MTRPSESGDSGLGLVASLLRSRPVPLFLGCGVLSKRSSSPVSRTTRGSESVERTDTSRVLVKKLSWLGDKRNIEYVYLESVMAYFVNYKLLVCFIWFKCTF